MPAAGGDVRPDPLLSVDDVARLYGTGVQAVVDAVASGAVASLDRGFLVHHGRHDVPLIRRSWAEAAQQEGPGASRRIDAADGVTAHPALAALMAVSYTHLTLPTIYSV